MNSVRRLRFSCTQPYRVMGFTLIEILVVLVIIAIMASMLAFSIGDNSSRQLEREADRLIAVLDMAAEEALLQGVELSLAEAKNADDTGYQFLWLSLADNQWQALTDKPFSFYPLPADISLTVTLDEKSLVFEGESIADQIQTLKQLKQYQQQQPLLMLFSSGEITPFELELRHQDLTEAIILRSDGVSGIERL